jgi:hypothetical protein
MAFRGMQPFVPAPLLKWVGSVFKGRGVCSGTFA